MKADELQGEGVEEDSCSSWENMHLIKPKIKPHPRGKVIFSAENYACLFNEETVVASITSMVSRSGAIDIPVLQLCILRQPAPERHKLCQLLCTLMSLTHDGELLLAMRKCTPLYDLGWRPNHIDLLNIFFNWGAPVALLCDRRYKPTSPPHPVLKEGNPRITSDNIKLVLHHMESGLRHALQGGEAAVDMLVKTFFLLLMEKIFVTTFTRRFLLHCFSALVDHIPDSLWNKQKVWLLSELVFKGFEDHIHDLSVLCKKLFTLCDRCEELGLHLAYRIVHQCFQTLPGRDDEVNAPELPVSVSHIIKLILAHIHSTMEMDLFYFDVIVDMMYTVIAKKGVLQDDKENVSKYLDYVLHSIRENYKSHDVTVIRQKIQRFSSLLQTKRSLL